MFSRDCFSRNLLDERVALLLQPHEPRFFSSTIHFELYVEEARRGGLKLDGCLDSNDDAWSVVICGYVFHAFNA